MTLPKSGVVKLRKLHDKENCKGRNSHRGIYPCITKLTVYFLPRQRDSFKTLLILKGNLARFPQSAKIAELSPLQGTSCSRGKKTKRVKVKKEETSFVWRIKRELI